MQIEKYLNLSIENKKRLEAILNRFDESEFQKFCVINEILEEGMKSFRDKYELHNPQLTLIKYSNDSQITDEVTDELRNIGTPTRTCKNQPLT